MGGAGARGTAGLTWPAGLAPVPLPPSSPARNPVERRCEPLQAKLANRACTDLAALAAALTAALRRYWGEPALLRRLTGYPWWTETEAAIAPAASGMRIRRSRA